MAGITFHNVSGNQADITIYQGKTLSFNYVWGGSTPIDVTGFDACLTIKRNFNETETIASFTVANGRVSIGDTNGVIGFTMSAADCAALPAPFDGVFEIEITTDSSTVHKGLYGDCAIYPEVCVA